MSGLSQADAPRTGDRQYHIALSRGELAEYILLVGDPGRVATVASRWDSVEVERSNREITTATGTYRGMRISCMSTGMGSDNVEIVLAEVMEITDQPTFVRVGSSGAPREHHGLLRAPRIPRNRRSKRGVGAGNGVPIRRVSVPRWADGDGKRVLRSAGKADAHAQRSVS